MNKIIIVVLLTVFLAAAGFAQDAQDFNNPLIMEKLGLTQQQIEQLKAIYAEAQEIIREAQLDIDIQTAMLKKALAQQNVNLTQVEGLLKSIADLEYEVRLAQITSQVQIRGVIGVEAWTVLNRSRNRNRLSDDEDGADEATREREREATEPEPSHTQDSKSKQ